MLLDKVRHAENRFERQHQKLEEDQQALELLLEEQKGFNARMCCRLSETAESPTTQPWLPRDGDPQQV